jgi:hypothetical protein
MGHSVIGGDVDEEFAVGDALADIPDDVVTFVIGEVVRDVAAARRRGGWLRCLHWDTVVGVCRIAKEGTVFSI